MFNCLYYIHDITGCVVFQSDHLFQMLWVFFFIFIDSMCWRVLQQLESEKWQVDPVDSEVTWGFLTQL